MWGDINEGNAVTTGCFDGSVTTEYTCSSNLSFSHIHLSRLIHRSAREVIDGSDVCFHSAADRFVPLGHQLRQPLSRRVPVRDAHTTLLRLLCGDGGENAQMVILASGDDPLSRRVEEGGVHRQRMHVLVETVRTLRVLLFHERVELPGGGETADVEEFDRAAERRREKEVPCGMKIDLRLRSATAVRCSPSYRAPGRSRQCRGCASR